MSQKHIKFNKDFEYYIIYKPFQYLSQYTSDGDKLGLEVLFKNKGITLNKNTYPVGRLDFDSEGLLLLTNDKSMTDFLLNPRNNHKRVYYIQVEGEVIPENLNTLLMGVNININGNKYLAKAESIRLLNEIPNLPDRNPPIRFRKSIPTSWIEITLTEGKNRQVRKMTAAIGYPTLRLVRQSMESITIDGFVNGEIRKIS